MHVLTCVYVGLARWGGRETMRLIDFPPRETHSVETRRGKAITEQSHLARGKMQLAPALLVWLAVCVSSASLPQPTPASAPSVPPSVSNTVAVQAHVLRGANTAAPVRRPGPGGGTPRAYGRGHKGYYYDKMNAWRGPIYVIRSTRPGYFDHGKEVVELEAEEEEEEQEEGSKEEEKEESHIEGGNVYPVDLVLSMISQAQHQNLTLPEVMEEEIQGLNALIANDTAMETRQEASVRNRHYANASAQWPKPFARGVETMSLEEKLAWENVRNRNDRLDLPTTGNGSWWSRSSTGGARSRSRSVSGDINPQQRRTYVSVSVAASPDDFAASEVEFLPSKSYIARESRSRQRGSALSSHQLGRSHSTGSSGTAVQQDNSRERKHSILDEFCSPAAERGWETVAATSAAAFEHQQRHAQQEAQQQQQHAAQGGYVQAAETEQNGVSFAAGATRVLPGVFSVQEVERGIMAGAAAAPQPYAQAYGTQMQMSYGHSAYAAPHSMPPHSSPWMSAIVPPPLSAWAVSSTADEAGMVQKGTMSLQAVEELILGAPASPPHVGDEASCPSPTPSASFPSYTSTPSVDVGRKTGAWSGGLRRGMHRDGVHRDGMHRDGVHPQAPHRLCLESPLTGRAEMYESQGSHVPVPSPEIVAAAEKAMSEAQVRRLSAGDAAAQVAGGGREAVGARRRGGGGRATSPSRRVGAGNRMRVDSAYGWKATVVPVPPAAVVAAAEAVMAQAAAKASGLLPLPPPNNPWGTGVAGATPGVMAGGGVKGWMAEATTRAATSSRLLLTCAACDSVCCCKCAAAARVSHTCVSTCV